MAKSIDVWTESLRYFTKIIGRLDKAIKETISERQASLDSVYYYHAFELSSFPSTPLCDMRSNTLLITHCLCVNFHFEFKYTGRV